jgi:hypothetical protein
MAAGPDDESEQWRFSLDELGEETEPATSEDEEERGDEGNIAGEFIPQGPLEPGEIDLENAVFVALGALLVVELIAAAFLGR